MQWQQTSLLIKASDLVIRNVKSIESPTFFASVSKQNSFRIVCYLYVQRFFLTITMIFIWMIGLKIINPFNLLSVYYQQSKTHGTSHAVIGKICSQPDERDRAPLLAASAAPSGDWLQALPISSYGVCLDHESARVAVGLRLSACVGVQYRYLCGTVVDCQGTHGLLCKKSSAKIARHSYINDIIHRAFVRVKIASLKEQVGLSPTDGMRPDGLTLVSWQVGKNLVCDVTVTDTLANSYLTSTSITAGSAADLAASHKEDKYIDMATARIFVSK